MARLSDKHRERLSAFWSGLPAGARDKVLSGVRAAAGSDPTAKSIAEILGSLEAAFAVDPDVRGREHLFDLLAPMTAEPGAAPPSRARFSPTFLDVVWTWLKEDAAPQLTKAAAEDASPPGSESWTERRAAAAELIAAQVDAAASDDRLAKKLATTWGPGALEAGAACAVLLRGDACLREALNTLPPAIAEFDPELCRTVRDRYEAMNEAAPDAAMWLLLFVMGRLKKPAQIFRAVEKIGKRSDDLVVSRTDLAGVGDAVLTDAAYHVSRFASPPGTREEAAAAAEGLADFVGLTVGMTREFGIRKDGVWGKRLFALRARASDQLADCFNRTAKALEAALPEPGRGKSGRALPPKPISPQVEAKAAARLAFLHAAHEWASQAAVSGAHSAAEDAAHEALDVCAAALLDAMRQAQGEERDAFCAALDTVIRLMQAGGRDETAMLMRRRSAAAIAA